MALKEAKDIGDPEISHGIADDAICDLLVSWVLGTWLRNGSVSISGTRRNRFFKISIGEQDPAGKEHAAAAGPFGQILTAAPHLSSRAVANA